MPDNFCIFSGSSTKELSEKIAKKIGKPLGKVDIQHFPDGEIGIRLLEDVNGKVAVVIASMAHNPNSYLMELLIMADALKRAAARKVVCIMPYFGYARQDQITESGEPITAKLVANMLQANVDYLITLELHSKQLQGFFDIPLENISSRKVFVEVIKKENIKNLVIVAPDVGRSKEARRLAEEFKVETAIIDKHRLSSSKVEAKALIGNVTGKNVIIFDDICSTGQTLLSAIKVVQECKAENIYAAIAHFLPNDDKQFLGRLKKIWITDSISNKNAGTLMQEVTVADFFVESLKKIV